MKEYLKKNYVFVLSIFAALLTIVGMFASFVSAKSVSVMPFDGWYVVSKIGGRETLNIVGIAHNEAATFVIVFYSLVAVGIALLVLGKYAHKNFLIGSTLLFITTGVLFLLSNSLYDLSLCYSFAKEPNLYEELHAVSEAKLAFGSVFASTMCFVSGLLSYSMANTKDSIDVKDMTEIAILSALAIGLQFIKAPIGSTGGSINLGLIPLFMIALRHGPIKGFMASAFIFGLITCLTDGYGFNTYPFDYLLGFGGVAVLGIFKSLCFNDSEKGYSKMGFVYIAIGVVAATLIRFVGGTASSMINYGYQFRPALAYNVVYVFVTGAVNLAAMELLFIPLARINKIYPAK